MHGLQLERMISKSHATATMCSFHVEVAEMQCGSCGIDSAVCESRHHVSENGSRAHLKFNPNSHGLLNLLFPTGRGGRFDPHIVTIVDGLLYLQYCALCKWVMS